MDAATTRSVRRRVRDLHALEGHVLEALEHQLDLDPRSTEVAQAIEFFRRRVSRSVERIGARIDDMPRVDGARLADSMVGVVGMAIGLVVQLRGTSVARAVRDDRVAFASVVVGYEMLLTTALAVGDVATAQMCELALRDYSACIRRVEDVLPAAALEELEGEPEVTVVNPGVARAVHAAVDRARRAA